MVLFPIPVYTVCKDPVLGKLRINGSNSSHKILAISNCYLPFFCQQVVLCLIIPYPKKN